MAQDDTTIKSRRDPIEVVIGERTFVAKPLGWRARNKLGEAISASYSKMLNETLFEIIKDEATGNDRYDFHFAEGQIDYDGILALAFPESRIGDGGDFEELSFEELVDQVLGAALTVNGLERMVYMVNLGKERPGPAPSDPAGDAGAKTESSPG